MVEPLVAADVEWITPILIDKKWSSAALAGVFSPEEIAAHNGRIDRILAVLRAVPSDVWAEHHAQLEAFRDPAETRRRRWQALHADKYIFGLTPAEEVELEQLDAEFDKP